MEKSWGLIGALLALAIVELCNGLPMDLLSRNEGPNAQLIGVLVGVMVSVCVIIAFIGCVCCQRRQGFKVFRDSPVTASVVNETSLTGDDPGHVNPIASPEFTIFTPLSPPHHNNNVFRSHQPVISYNNQNENQSELPNKLINPQIDGIDVSSWFNGSDFPRSKLKYIRELGNGWFGRVVEGEAQEIEETQQNGWTPVAVRILESSASAHEQALFLHEANMYRLEPNHPNILRLFGRSLEATPLLLIQEYYPKGDLKKFLLENRSSSSSPVMTGLPLKFCCQLASAVQFLHEKKIPHLDLAARTCQITSDLTLKLGDYGLAVSQYPNDYYQGTPAIPVRWCAPETLNYTNTTLQPKQVTCEGNIWSLGVTMWEICEWGTQPYDWLTDDEVVSQVMGAPHVRLPQPSLKVYYIQPLYRLMQLCWQSSESRPQINQIYSMLMHLLQQYQQNNASISPSKAPNFPMEDFDSRWETFKPNTIVKTDNHVTCSVPDKNTDVSSVSSSEIFVNPEKHKSPSLTNLHGSLENLIEDDAETPVQNMDSWLQNVANRTSDMQYVRGLSQAIQALDSALASEQTSSSASSFEPSPATESLETSQDQLKIEFKLGEKINFNQLSLDESTNTIDSILFPKRLDSGSETEDETWKRRIERGAYSEKVRQKSKSVADLMILTHIDCSDTDSETPLQSLEYRVNYKNVRCKPNSSLENSNLMFGSEGNLLEVQDTFQKELKKLQEERRDSLLFVPAYHSSQHNIKTSAERSMSPFTNTDNLFTNESFISNQTFNDKSISANTKCDTDLIKSQESSVNNIVNKDIRNISVETKNIDKRNEKVDTQNNIQLTENKNDQNNYKIETNISKETTDKLDDKHDNKIEIPEVPKSEPQINLNDSFIRQEVSNLISEITSEAQEEIYKSSEEPKIIQNISNVSTPESSEDPEIIKNENQDKSEHVSIPVIKVTEEILSSNEEENSKSSEEPRIIQTENQNISEYSSNVSIPEIKITLEISSNEEEISEFSGDPEINQNENQNISEHISNVSIPEIKVTEEIFSSNDEDIFSRNQEIDTEKESIVKDEIINTETEISVNEECKTEEILNKNEEKTNKIVIDVNPEILSITETLLNHERMLSTLEKNVDFNQTQQKVLEESSKSEEIREITGLTEENIIADICSEKEENKFETTEELIQIQEKVPEDSSKLEEIKEITDLKEENIIAGICSLKEVNIPERTEKLIQIQEKVPEDSSKSEEIKEITDLKEENIIADICSEKEVNLPETTEELIQIQEKVPEDSSKSEEIKEITGLREENIIADICSEKEVNIPETTEELIQIQEKVPEDFSKSVEIKEITGLREENIIADICSEKEVNIPETTEELIQIQEKVPEDSSKSEEIKEITGLKEENIIAHICFEKEENIPKTTQEKVPEDSSKLEEIKEITQLKEENNKEIKNIIADICSEAETKVEAKLTLKPEKLLPSDSVESQNNIIFETSSEEISNKPKDLCKIDVNCDKVDNSSKVESPDNTPADLLNLEPDLQIEDFEMLDTPVVISEITTNVSQNETENLFEIVKNLDETVISPINQKIESQNKNLQELLNVDNQINNKLGLPQIITCKKEDYSLVQNFINNERNGPITEIERNLENTAKSSEIPETPLLPTNLLDLQDTSNTNPQPKNQVYNVYSVQVDHKLPPEVFESPIKNLYSKPYNETDLLTGISDLLIENDVKSPEKLLSQLNLVCTTSLPNDHLFNVLNTPPLINGFDSELSSKFIDNLKNDNKNLQEKCHENKNFDEKITKKSIMGNYIFSNNTNQNPETESDAVKHDDYNNPEIKSLIDNNTPKSIKDAFPETSDKPESFFDNDDNLKSPKKLADMASDILEKHLMYINDDDLNTNSIFNFQNTSNDDLLFNPRKLSDIILDSLKNNPDYRNDSHLKDQKEENINDLNMTTSTPFKRLIKKSNGNDSPSENSKCFSFVSEGDETSDSQTTVILGPCEDYTLGLYSGLKTTFGKYSDDDRPEEEILQFSSNFMPFNNEPINFPSKDFDAVNNSVDYSLETWDRFLGKTLQDHDNGPTSIFEHDNFSLKNDSLDIFNDKNSEEISNETIDVPNKTIELPNKDLQNITFEIEHKNDDLNKTVTLADTENKNLTFELNSNISDNIEDNETDAAILNSWEPGEGWFLHPQTAPENLSGDIDISGGDNSDDNSYVRFTLDEECVNALRNELAAKLPHAQGSSHEEQQEPEEWDTEERNEIIVKYNVYATPLSPIPEESCCEDAYCDQLQHRDGSDSDSDWSEPCMGRTSQLEDILIVDTETHTAQLLESPSLREPQHRHTPSQDSCCSNDTLFNLDDLNYGTIDNENSPQHLGIITTPQHEIHEKDQVLEVELTDNVAKNDNISSLDSPNDNSIEMNVTYTKPDINIDISEYDNSNKENNTITLNSAPAIIEETEAKPNKLELKLEPSTFGVAPLPSPEDIPWKQIPASLLTYNEIIHPQNDKFEMTQSQPQSQNDDISLDNTLLSEETTETLQDNNNETFLNNEDDDINQMSQEHIKLDEDFSDSQKECTVDADLYSNLTDIRFSGPCDAQLMSTSFSESVDYADERDWDSGSDTRSSSSGEFIWKEGEHEESLRALHAASHDVGVTDDLNPMDAIEEENSNASDDSDDGDEDIEETEFVPSAWDAQATPTKSALRSPEKSSKRKNQQKGVWFKKQKFHCVYEYPREPESPVQQSSDLWRPLSDFPNFTDWELDPDTCVSTYDDNSLDCRDGAYDPVLDRYLPKSNFQLASANARHRDLYQLNPFPDCGPGLSGSDEDFFISSSAKPFQSSSQFFPGQNQKSKFLWQDYQSSSSQSSRDLSDNITPDSGIDDITPASLSDAPTNLEVIQMSPPKNKVQSLKCLAALATKKTAANEIKTQDSLGGLRHTRNRLKLDLPPSPNAFSSTRSFSIDLTNDPVVNREVPTFTTFGKTRFSVQHVQTPTEDSDSSGSMGKPKSKNVSFEALPHKPLKLQPINTVYIVSKPDDNDKQKPVVESVQGEASLLDSADEDSGIESSANATLERREQQILN